MTQAPNARQLQTMFAEMEENRSIIECQKRELIDLIESGMFYTAMKYLNNWYKKEWGNEYPLYHNTTTNRKQQS